jgi:hypothetical protein
MKRAVDDKEEEGRKKEIQRTLHQWYDLNTNHIEQNGHDSSNVYKFLGSRMHRRGWTKHQYSCWRIPTENHLKIR